MRLLALLDRFLVRTQRQNDRSRRQTVLESLLFVRCMQAVAGPGQLSALLHQVQLSQANVQRIKALEKSSHATT